VSDKKTKTEQPDKPSTWRDKFWEAVNNYAIATGGEPNRIVPSDPNAHHKAHARREIEALITHHPSVDQQLRLDYAGCRIRMNAAIVAAHSLIGIAQHMATGKVGEKEQEAAQETLAKASETLKQLMEVKA